MFDKLFRPLENGFKIKNARGRRSKERGRDDQDHGTNTLSSL
jgi:hypothetical protein